MDKFTAQAIVAEYTAAHKEALAELSPEFERKVAQTALKALGLPDEDVTLAFGIDAREKLGIGGVSAPQPVAQPEEERRHAGPTPGRDYGISQEAVDETVEFVKGMNTQDM